jgi:hypothetical protein
MASRQSERQTAATARPQDTVEESAGVAYRSQAAIAQSDELRQLLQQDDTAKSGAQGTGEAVQLRADEGASESEAEADGDATAGLSKGIVDRIEGEFAVIESAETGDFVDVPLTHLPPWIKEGDRFDGQYAGPAKIPRGIIERIEGDYAVIEDQESGDFVDIPVPWLPPGIKEGDRIDGKLVGPGRLPKGIIDRIEGDYAVVEDSTTLEFVDVPLTWLPEGIKEGDSVGASEPAETPERDEVTPIEL